MSFIINAFYFIVVIAILVSFHEFGHFIAARLSGVRVLKFSVGFGKSILSYQKNNLSTEYSISMIPLGGYVKMLDEREGNVSPDDRGFAFNRQSISKRCFIVLAGPFANLLLAFIFYWGIGLIGTTDLAPVVGKVEAESIGEKIGFEKNDQILEINGDKVQGWSQYRLQLIDIVQKGEALTFSVRKNDGIIEKLFVKEGSYGDRSFTPMVLRNVFGLYPDVPVATTRLGEVINNSPADIAGLMEGDLVASVNGVEISEWGELVAMISNNPSKPTDLLINRDSNLINISVTPDAIKVGEKTIGRIGIRNDTSQDYAQYLVTVQLGVYQAGINAVETTWLMSRLTVNMLYKMLIGKESKEHISGPITIARYAGQSADLGVVQFLAFLAVLSVSLGILNLLPIPVLDGGHILMLIIEAIRRKPLSDRFQNIVQQFGILIIILLMTIAFYNDILALVS